MGGRVGLTVNVEYSDVFQKLYKAAAIYAKLIELEGDTDVASLLRNKVLDAWVFYMLYGYNKDTMDILKQQYGINSNYVNQINHKLRKLGLIEQSPNNLRKSDLSEFSKNFVEYFTKWGDNVFFVLAFNKNENGGI